MCKKSLLTLINISVCLSCLSVYGQRFGSNPTSGTTIFFDVNEKTYTWGSNLGPIVLSYKMGIGDTNLVWTPTDVPVISGLTHWVDGTHGASIGVYIGDDSNLYFSGSQLPSYFGDTVLMFPSVWPNPIGVTGWESVSLFSDVSMIVLTTDGQAYYWDRLGNPPDLTHVEFPEGVIRWNKVVAGEWYYLLLGDNERLYAFGRNDYGQLGDKTNNNRSKPIQVYSPVGVYKWKSMTGGFSFSLGVDSSGKLYHWGQLAPWNPIGTSKNEPTPYAINETWKKVAISGGDLVVGLTTTGKIYVWGGSDSLLLGLGDGRNRLTEPTLMPFPEGVTEWRDITAGSSNAYALDQECRVWAWGYNTEYNPIGVPPDSGDVFSTPRIIRQFCLQNDVNVSPKRNQPQLHIYPNPVSQNISVEFTLESSQRVDITVLDMLGRTVRSFNGLQYQSGTHNYSMPLAGLTPGSYILWLETTSGVGSTRFIVN